MYEEKKESVKSILTLILFHFYWIEDEFDPSTYLTL